MNKIWDCLFILILAIPIGGTGYEWLDFLRNQYGVNLFDVLYSLFTLFLLLRIRMRFKIRKDRLIYIFLVFISIINFIYTLFKGYSFYGMKAIRDSFHYVMCLEYLIAGILISYKHIDYKRIVDLTRKGYIGYTIITVITFLFFNTIDDRIGSNCFSLSIMLIPYEIYLYFENKQKNSKRFYSILFCFLINSLASQNRTAIFLVIALIAYIIVTLFIKKTSEKTKKKILLVLTIFIIIGTILVISKSDAIIRILTGGEVNTFSSRIKTFNYYFELFKQKPFGYGFGFIMHFFTSGNYMLEMETYQIDNAMIVYGIKGGIIMIISYSLLMLLPLKIKFLDNKYELRLFRISYLFFLVAVYLMTSQIIQGRATALFTWTIVGLLLKHTENVKKGDVL